MKKRTLFLVLASFVLLGVVFQTAALAAAENWVFEKTLPGEPYYYFKTPTALDFDADGNIYTVETGVEGGAYFRIKKYNSEGILDTSWGGGDGIIGVGPPAAFDIAVTPSGELFVPDIIDYSIKKYDASGVLDTSWGTGGMIDTYGPTNISIGEVHGIDLDGDGNIYFKDSENDHVVKLDANGDLDTTWGGGNGYIGSYGSGDDEFDGRYGSLTVTSDGVLYVTDSENHRVKKYTSAGVRDLTWGGGDGIIGTGSLGTGPDEFNVPVGLALKSDGSLYVSDPLNGRVKRYDANGVLDLTWGGGDGMLDDTGDTKLFDFCYGLEIDSSDNLYIADLGVGRFIRYTDDGVLDTSWLDNGMLRSKKGDGSDRFNAPLTIAACEPTGAIYIVDTGNSRIKRILPDGSLDTSWGGGDGIIGQKGTGGLDFDAPSGLAVLSDGVFYVADTNNNRIKRYNLDGSLDTSWGGGDGIIDFSNPCGIALDADENLFVSSRNNNNIKKLTPDGSLDTSWGGGDGIVDSWAEGNAPKSLSNPNGLAIDIEGNLYVADSNNDRIVCFDADGEVDFEWGIDADGQIGSFNSGTDQLNYPRSIAFDYAGNLYVADTNNSRIVRFNSNGLLDTSWFADGIWEIPGTKSDTDQPYESVLGIAFYKGRLFSSWDDRILMLRDTVNMYDGIAGLADLKIDGKSISGFSESTTDYTVTVPYGRDYVKIDAAGNSYVKKVTGTGYRSLSSNTTTFSVVANAVDNSTKVYTVTVKVAGMSTSWFDVTADSVMIDESGLSLLVPSGENQSIMIRITMSDGKYKEFPIIITAQAQSGEAKPVPQPTSTEPIPNAGDTSSESETVVADAGDTSPESETVVADVGDTSSESESVVADADVIKNIIGQPESVFPWWWILVGVLAMCSIGLGFWVFLLKRIKNK